MRPLLMRLHFYAGVLVGPFVVVAALTGMLYALAPQAEQLLYRDQLTTDVRGQVLPLSQQIASARTRQPNAELAAVRPAPEPGRTTRVLFRTPGLGESEQLAVFVDPVSGEVRGQLVTYGRDGALPFRAWLDALHRDLHLGEPGRLYSELAASWLWVVVLAGLLLWWTRRRRRARGGARRRTLSWHATVGTWAALGLLMLSATGLTWSRFAGANVTDLRTALSWTTPTLVEHTGHGEAGGTHGHLAGDVVGVGADGAVRAAARHGLSAPLQVTPPRPGGDNYVVEETSPSWPARSDAVAVDAHTGEVTEVARFADWPLPAKLAHWGVQLHMGLLFGVGNQLALVALALATVLVVAYGYRMWWQRRPTRGHVLRLGRPVARGAWRRAPRPAVAALLAAAMAVGWFLPVFGVSLLGFLLVDVAVGLAGRRRRRLADGDALTEDGACLARSDDVHGRAEAVAPEVDAHVGAGVVVHVDAHAGPVVATGRVRVRDAADVQRAGGRGRGRATEPGEHRHGGKRGEDAEETPHADPSVRSRT